MPGNDSPVIELIRQIHMSWYEFGYAAGFRYKAGGYGFGSGQDILPGLIELYQLSQNKADLFTKGWIRAIEDETTGRMQEG